MSRLDELIAELCPDGVEYKNLSDVCKISNGKDHKGLADGDIPVYGSGGVMRNVDTYIYNKQSVLIPRKGSIGNLFYINVPFWAVDTIFYTKINEHVIFPKFLYYSLKTQHLEDLNTAGGVPSLTKTILDKVIIPMPPLPIQHEIANILDKFTTLEAELEAELQDELEARKRQYDYYRNQLLTFNNHVPILQLREISTKSYSGGTPLANHADYYGGDIPWLRTQEVRFRDIYDTEIRITPVALKKSAAKWIPTNCVIIAISGATAGRSAINKIPLTTNQHCCCLEIDPQKANYRYVFHWVCSKYNELKALGQGARSDLNSNIIKSYPIPIPPLEEQERIIAILDRFDVLVNDVAQSLLAEISARHKQYEYYRNKLLTFKEKV